MHATKLGGACPALRRLRGCGRRTGKSLDFLTVIEANRKDPFRRAADARLTASPHGGGEVIDDGASHLKSSSGADRRESENDGIFADNPGGLRGESLLLADQ